MSKNVKNFRVHFIGVNGAGMSVLCSLLLTKNFTVSGSDIKRTSVTCELEKRGLTFYLGHDKQNVKNADVVIYSSAISENNEELVFAKKMKKAVYSRAELLKLVIDCYKKSIGISGSHGKTTVTSMLSNVLHYSNLSPTCLIGGEDCNLGSFLSGNKNILVSEICEFNKNVKDIKTKYTACLNVDNDHLDSYGSIENLKMEFFNYLDRSKIKFINLDDKFLCDYKGKNIVTYAIENQSTFKAENLTIENNKYQFDLYVKSEFKHKFKLNVVGKHNVYNALCVIAIAKTVFNLEYKTIYEGLLQFKGVKRRMEVLGSIEDKTIIADYAHHPTEIKSTINTVKEVYHNNYLLVFQPHTYSRTKLLYDEFLAVLKGENVIVFKEYPARENYDYLGSSERLASELNADYVEEFEKLMEKIKSCKSNNVIVIGAGDLYDLVKEKIC